MWPTSGSVMVPFARMPEGCRTGAWPGLHNQNSPDAHYRLGLYAQVVDRITERRGEHVAVRYERPRLPEGSWGAQLNSWNHLRVPTFRAYAEPCPHIPYTEPAAEFFYRLPMRLCALTDQLAKFFPDPVSVVAALEGTGVLALPGALWNPGH